MITWEVITTLAFLIPRLKDEDFCQLTSSHVLEPCYMDSRMAALQVYFTVISLFGVVHRFKPSLWLKWPLCT